MVHLAAKNLSTFNLHSRLCRFKTIHFHLFGMMIAEPIIFSWDGKRQRLMFGWSTVLSKYPQGLLCGWSNLCSLGEKYDKHLNHNPYAPWR